MKPTDDLFILIKSMKQNEKRYFKIHAKQFRSKENHTLIRLFEAIEKLKTYDETIIKNKFKGEAFVKHLPVVKNQLEGIILKSLNAFHSGSVNAKLREYLDSAEVLYNKGLFSHCEKSINKGLKLANEYNRLYYELIFLDWKCRLRIRSSEYEQAIENNNEAIELIGNQTSALLTKKQNLTLVKYVMQKGLIRSYEQQQELEKLYFDKKYPDEKKLNTIEGKYYYYSALNLYFSVLNDHEKRIEACEKLIFVFEECPKIIKENYPPYISALINYANALFNAKQYKALGKTVEKLKVLGNDLVKTKADDVYVQLMILTYEIEILMNIKVGNKEKITEQEKAIKMLITLYGKQVQKNNINSLAFNLAKVQFYYENFDSALYWCNYIINECDNTVREDIFIATKLLMLMLQHELGNMQFLDNLTTSTEKFLLRKKEYTDIEKALIRFFKEQLKNNVNAYSLQNLQKKIIELEAQSKKSNIAILLNLNEWVAAKINRKPLYSFMFSGS